ncbi:hypothetical protein GCM10029976_093000 [Kribbella albertanoniae]|uniref:Transcriptional regulator n=1 Tax=Kribbella albertanoniae TaxID=1266829 RepID=A0A4R4QCF0_9ACTN|nr:transcriptional regulator [Kribbella albertanoniae]TDC33156.1 transcriptional regulator [Kribbella albertanoniae]
MNSSPSANSESDKVAESRRRWFDERRYLVDNRHQLAIDAADGYAPDRRVAGTPLLAPESWIPAKPIPLTSVALEFDSAADFTGTTGRESVAHGSIPLRIDGSHYGSYAETIADLAPPAVFENRSTYRLISADLTTATPFLRMGRGTYFDSINTGEASAHEYAAQRLAPAKPASLRSAIGDPWDATSRPVNIAISTLTIRRDEDTGDSTFFLHWRDPAKVGHAGGLYQVVPVGIFQPSAAASWNEQHDFSLWRNVVRELSEELLGESEDYGSSVKPISYDEWPFAARLSAGLDDGSVQASCVGLGVDPLTFATDLLTVVSINSPLFDELFGKVVEANDEGRVLAPQPFTGEVVDEFVRHQPMQAAGAAVLQLAWDHRLG